MVDYVTAAEPEIPRMLRLSRVVATGLPVEINVQDFFRGTRSVDLRYPRQATLIIFLQAFHRVHLVDKDTPACPSALGTVTVAGPDYGCEGNQLCRQEAWYCCMWT